VTYVKTSEYLYWGDQSFVYVHYLAPELVQ